MLLSYTLVPSRPFMTECQTLPKRCGSGILPRETALFEPGADVTYQFDHLLPGQLCYFDLTPASAMVQVGTRASRWTATSS